MVYVPFSIKSAQVIAEITMNWDETKTNLLSLYYFYVI